MFPPYTIILPYSTIKFFIYCPPYTCTTILPCMLIQELRVKYIKSIFIKSNCNGIANEYIYIYI